MGKFLSINIKIARLCGVWHKPNDCFYYLHTVFMVSVQIAYIFSQFLYLIFVKTDMVSALRVINMIALSFITFYRAMIWFIDERKMQSLIREANNPDKFDNSHEIVFGVHRFALGYTLYLVTSTESLVIFAYGPSVYQLLTTDDLTKIHLPYNTWTPFDKYRSKEFFGLAMFYQIMGIYVTGHLLTSITTFYTSLMAHIFGQLKLLSHKFHLLGEKEKIVDEEFRDCVVHLKNTIELYNQIAYHNSIGLSGQLFPIAFILMSSVLLFTTQPIQSCGPELIFGVACLFDILTYCWFGEEICYQSEQTFLKLLEIKWYNESKKFKKNYQLTVTRLSQNIVMKVGGFLPLRLATFVQILRGTYSIFAVLRTFVGSK